MRGLAGPAIGLALLTVAANLPVGGQSNAPGDYERRVLVEIEQLRAELVRYLADSQESRVASLVSELDEARQIQKSVQAEERQRLQQISQVEQQLENADLEPEVRPQIEALRAQLTSETAERLRAEQATADQRVVDIEKRLEREKKRDEMLQQRSRQLETALHQP